MVCVPGARGVQWLYAFVALLNVVFVFTFLPETHNRTLSEIEDYFERHTFYLGHRRQSREPAPAPAPHANLLHRQCGRRHRHPDIPGHPTQSNDSSEKRSTVIGETEIENPDSRVSLSPGATENK